MKRPAPQEGAAGRAGGTVASIKKWEILLANDSKIVCDVTRWGGELRLDMRLYFKAADGAWKATKNGFFGPIGLAEPLAQALQEIAKEQETVGFGRNREYLL